MRELIDRSAIFDAVRNANNLDEALEAIDNADKVRIQIVANISGGLLQGASANVEGVEIYALDFDDVPADEPENTIEVDGSEAHLGQSVALYEPDFVRKVVEAPSLKDLADEEEELPKITDDIAWLDLKDGQHALVRGTLGSANVDGLMVRFPDWSELFIAGDASNVSGEIVIVEVERTEDGLKFIKQVSGL